MHESDKCLVPRTEQHGYAYGCCLRELNEETTVEVSCQALRPEHWVGLNREIGLLYFVCMCR